MRWFLNIGVAWKIGMAFGLCLVLAWLVGVVGIASLNKVSSNTDEIAQGLLPDVASLARFGADSRMVRLWQYRLARASKENIAPWRAKLSENVAKADADLEEYEKRVSTGKESTLFNSLKDSWKTYLELSVRFDRYVDALKHDDAESYIVNDMGKQALGSLFPAVDKLTDYNQARADFLAREGAARYRQSIKVVVLMLLAATIVGLSFAGLTVKIIKTTVTSLGTQMRSMQENCLNDLTHGLRALERGDLTVPAMSDTAEIAVRGHDELGKASVIFNDLVAKTAESIDAYESTRSGLADIVRRLRDNAALVAQTGETLASSAEETNLAATSIAETVVQVAQGAEESANTSRQIAQGTEQLAASATELGAAMNGLGKAIGGVRTGSETQSKAIEQTLIDIEAGTAAIEKTVATISRIKVQMDASTGAVRELGEKGQQIGDIVQTIEDIAQQTNLLALNAAIEAARAGEQGKGFAVVADEVRKLAERSAEATKEIGALIASVRAGVDEAVKAMDAGDAEVQEGSARSAEAGEALDRIMASSKAVTQATALNQQAVAQMAVEAEQVSESVSVVGSVSEENASAAEQLSAGAEEMSASTQTVTSAVEEQTASMEQVSASAQELNAMSAELFEIVQRFKIDEANASLLESANSTKRRKAA